jgi:pilus assembly protein FimV
MRKSPRWQASALAAAAVLSLGFASSSALALSLGRLTVQSALGEPLRAEIDIPDINAEEAASLKASVASPDAFRAAGLDYNAAMPSLLVTLQRRPDGGMFLRLSSERPVSDPFIDLILEANWSSGRIVRDYTMLFDPPSMRQGSMTAPTAPQISTRPVPAPAPAPAASPPAVFSRPAPAAPPAVAVAAAPARAQPARPAARPAATGDGKQVKVQAGDTAGRIAASNKPESVSLDQMLVALLRANPDAFIGGNINRLKAGAVLDLPGEAQASSIPASEATQTVIAQSKNFNEFRRKLAEGAPATQVAAADRQAGGKLQAQVEDKKPSAPAPDKLTLSKGSAQAKAGEDKIAKDRQAQDASARVAELSKNITELNKLGAASGAAGPATNAASVAKGGINVAGTTAAAAAVAASAAKPPASAATPTPAPVQAAVAPAASAPASSPAVAVPVAAAASAAASAPPVATAASATASAAVAPAAAASTASSAAAAALPASAPAPAASAPSVAKPAPAPAAAPESSLLDDMLDNPLVPVAGGVLVALLAGFGFYRARQRKKMAQVDSSFLESRLQPDSFFGASGGQRIDTNDGGATGSSMVYSPSQLDAAGDVDPVAEADVYLAYGRDLQAEEILKEALRTNPSRVAIHGKLLEIYAKRRDAKAFEVVATEAYGLTRGEGPEWEHACELGRELDSANPLYQPGGHPAGSAGAGSAATAAAAGASSFAASTIPQSAHPELLQSPAPVDLDLDLDFSLGDDLAPPPLPAASSSAASFPEVSTVALQSVEPPPLDMDFSAATVAMHAPTTPALSPEPVRLSVPDLALSASGLSFSPEPAAAPASPASPAAAAPVDSGMIEFDLGSLSLDLGPTTEAPAEAAAGDHDPLSTKLALAEEFHAIGDADGARALVSEVIAEASGSLKAKAQRFLAELG